MAELQKAPWPDWETVNLIGHGSFGTVYEIQRKLVDEDTESAALKVITIPQNPGDVEEMYSEGYDNENIIKTFNSYLKNIIAEYSLMRKMEGSANIVNCKDIRYIQHNDGFGWDIYIRMELLTPLMKALSADVSESTVVKIGKDICKALVLCKKHEIVHRDIKPQNIFLSPNGDYKLGDFGIAKTIEKTMSGTRIGTFKYMAPEVYNNQPYGSAADIYSLGLVLYWLLNERRMPFMPLSPAKLNAGQDEGSRCRRFSGEQLPEPAHGSIALKQIVLKACAYDPKDRYASAAAMLEDLNKLVDDIGSSATTVLAGNYTEPHDDDKTISLVFENTVNTDYTVLLAEEAITCPDSAATATTVIEETSRNSDVTERSPLQKTRKRKRWAAVLAVLFLLCLVATAFVPVYGDWTEWSLNTLDVKKAKTETIEQYRFRTCEIIEITEGEVPPASAELICQNDVISANGEWSIWQTEPIEETENIEVQSADLYSYCTITIEESYSSWSEGHWTDIAPVETDLVDVAPHTVYAYAAYRYACQRCNKSVSALNLQFLMHAANHETLTDEQIKIMGDAVYGNGSQSAALEAAHFAYESTTLKSIDAKIAIETSGTAPYIINDNEIIWYTDSANPTRTSTQYFVRERTIIKREHESEWSAFSETPVEENETTRVNRVLHYRSRKIEKTTTSKYGIYGSWSEWQTTQIPESSDNQVQKETFYRYAEKYFLWQKLFGLIP